MSYRCLDSIYPANLPAADAYLAYVDGHWQTIDQVRAKFPRAHVISVAVFATDDAEGLDVEYHDATPAQTPGWTRRQLKRRVWRPVLYASISRMPTVVADLAAAGIARGEVRLLSAHYGKGKHICGPQTCRYQGDATPQCDGTQWRAEAPIGVNGAPIDESELDDQFFTEATTMSANGPEHWDDADWAAFTVHITQPGVRDPIAGAVWWWAEHALTGTIPADAAPPWVARAAQGAKDGLAALLAAELSKIPAAAGAGLTPAQVQAASEAAVRAVFAKASQ